jgi:hypothetical protein
MLGILCDIRLGKRRTEGLMSGLLTKSHVRPLALGFVTYPDALPFTLFESSILRLVLGLLAWRTKPLHLKT